MGMMDGGTNFGDICRTGNARRVDSLDVENEGGGLYVRSTTSQRPVHYGAAGAPPFHGVYGDRRCSFH